MTRSLADHAELTALSYRQNILSDASVLQVSSLSPTVKGYRLRVEDPRLTFRAGQWVDVFIPGVDQVGGFSICSAPSLLRTSSEIHLAVKESKWPPAYWFHSRCRPGDVFKIRVGGDFFLHDGDFLHDGTAPSRKMADVVLIAGGVGINPLLSMGLHLADLQRARPGCPQLPDRVVLLYGARTRQELIFRDVIASMKTELQSLDVRYFVSREPVAAAEASQYREGRVTEADLEAALQQCADRTKVVCYLCGPRSMMTDDFLSGLRRRGVSDDRLFYEKWW